MIHNFYKGIYTYNIPSTYIGLSGAGAAIAPPPSLGVDEGPGGGAGGKGTNFSGMGSTVAAKIMAKYGFKVSVSRCLT